MFKRKESGRFGLPTAYLVTITFLASLSFPFYSTGVEADMFSWFGLFKKKEVYLSPEVKGVIKENGKAVAQIQVTRQLIFIDEVERIDHAETDDKGQFYFPEKTLMSRMASNPLAQLNVSQHIYVERENKKYQLWGASQAAYEEVPEYSKKLAWLDCDLSNKLISFEFKRNEGVNMTYVSTSICMWDNDYLPFFLYDHDGKKYYINNGDLNNLTER
tara:strand:- start:1382 stop:2029 length:648 start_codon:yes stop_codon:yes gene_type:complete